MKQKERFYVVGKWAGERWCTAEVDGNKICWCDGPTLFYDEGKAETVHGMAIAFFENWLDLHIKPGEKRYDYIVKICEIDEEEGERV